jgi:hypothetical protein
MRRGSIEVGHESKRREWGGDLQTEGLIVLLLPPPQSPGSEELGCGEGGDDGAAPLCLPVYLSLSLAPALYFFSLEFLTGTFAPTNNILPRDEGSPCLSLPCGRPHRLTGYRPTCLWRWVTIRGVLQFPDQLTEYSENSSSWGEQLCRWIAVWAVPAFLGNMLLVTKMFSIRF